ncbi:TPA: hydrolase [Streptococcus pyogenes]|nr:hydrolase [Streptococcus pyogenes]HES7722061.1 hydrolase [Streptococcus pyogenes]
MKMSIKNDWYGELQDRAEKDHQQRVDQDKQMLKVITDKKEERAEQIQRVLDAGAKEYLRRKKHQDTEMVNKIRERSEKQLNNDLGKLGIKTKEQIEEENAFRDFARKLTNK